MTKRKYSIINYIDSEECSNNKGKQHGENLAKLFKKEPTFNFKSYLDGVCNGYTLEFKSIKKSLNEESSSTNCFDTKPSINPVTLSTYIDHEKASYNKGNKDGRSLFKNSENEFINFKCYLDGVCDGYTNYETQITKHSPFNFFGFNDCVTRLSFPSTDTLETSNNTPEIENRIEDNVQ